MSNKENKKPRNIKSPNWKSVKLANGKELFGNNRKKKKDIDIFGAVTRNHASTIVSYSYKDGKEKQVVSSTHQLPKKAQLEICKLLDSKKEDNFKIYLYDDKKGSKK